MTYILRDSSNQPYTSVRPGRLGGHARGRIYGRLDCKSALRWIAKGHYVTHRVFFIDERTAVAAGYRPCGNCMKEAYVKWKEHGAATREARRELT